MALLPDRSSRIPGSAAATVLELPVVNFDSGEPALASLVIAYDLTAAGPAAVAALRRRGPRARQPIRLSSRATAGLVPVRRRPA